MPASGLLDSPQLSPTRGDVTQFAGQHPLRVLHVINGEHYSGAERVQDLLAEYLPAEGCSVGFAALKSGKFDTARRSKSTPLVSLAMRSRYDLAAARRLARHIDLQGYDVLHAHTPRALLVAALAAGPSRLPLVYHVHSPVGRDSTRRLQNLLNAGVERACLWRTNHLIVVAPSLVEYMRGFGIAPTRITCVPNGVPAASVVRQRSRPSGEPFIVGMVALFRPRKGTESLLEAVATALGQGCPLKLRLIGGCESPDYQALLLRQIDQLGIADCVGWTGFVSNVGAELAKLDAMVLPSLFGEGLPMVVLEAMAAGVPVIASAVEGNTLAVEHGQSGLLIPAGDSDALAVALAELARGEIDAARLAAQAQTRHAELFSATAMARGVANVYRHVLGAATTGSTARSSATHEQLPTSAQR